MSEAATRFRQPIDLDEFEQRLRSGLLTSDAARPNPANTNAAHNEDPLAELARLVGQADPFRANNAAPQLRPAAARSAVPAVRPAAPHLQQVHPSLDRAEPIFDLPAANHPQPDLAIASAEPELQAFEQPLPYEPVYLAAPSGVEHAPSGAGVATQAAVGEAAHQPQFAPDLPPPTAEIPSAAAIAAAEGEGPRRSWRGVIILSAVLATGFAGLAAALTMKGSLSSSTATIIRKGNEPPVILAGGPTKVAPPKNAADVPDDQPSVLDKTASTKPSKAKLVDNAEQPVDLSQQPAGTRPSVAQNAPTPTADAPNVVVKPVAPRQVASLDPVAATPGPMGSRDGAAAVAKRVESDPPPGPGRNGFPEPRRVKVVSVRPDGSIIGSEPEAKAAAQVPAPAPAPAPMAEEPPKPVEMGVVMPSGADPMAQQYGANDMSVRTDAPIPSPQAEKGDKERRRDAVAALIDSSKSDVKADRASAKAAEQAEPKANPDAAKPARQKSAVVADLGSHDKVQDKAAAQDVADDGGKFAAQLAASPTESAAKATLRKLKKKYGSTFGGHKLSYRRVKVDGKTVYRVRLTGLSKGDADTVCGKLQDDGGTCFVARN